MTHIIEKVQQIRSFSGHPCRFWPAFLEIITRLAGAQTGILLTRDGQGGVWKLLNVWPAGSRELSLPHGLNVIVERVAEKTFAGSSLWECTRLNGSSGLNKAVMGIRLMVADGEQPHVVVLLLDSLDDESLMRIAAHAQLVADTPAIYQRERAARQTLSDLAQFSMALDLMVLLNDEKKYIAAAMTFVNEIASRFRCQRASLGWVEKGYVRMQAISHMERFEKKMDIVQRLEAVMEEAFDQNEEILWPLLPASTAIARDHEAFSRDQGIQFMVSMPVRLDGETAGVLTCERAREPFTEDEVRGLRLLCDQASRRLDDLKKGDRWFGARIKAEVRRGASRLVGVEHTFAKCIGLLVSAVLLFFVFGSLPYRVEAPFILRSNDVGYLPAPYEGYIDQVHVKVGDRAEQGQLLLSLEKRDLLLEESAAIANQNRYLREAEKARSESALADMKIALALAEQARARLDLVRHHLGRAEVKAPFSGIVVEGDLKKLQGAAVKKGDVLFKISGLEEMYAELEMSEREIHEIAENMSGEMAFVSKPHKRYRIRVERIDPVAEAKKDKGNVFRVHCLFTGGVQDWWRPGMSGIAKLDAGRRNAFWILAHRTIDFLRIKLWW